MAYSVKKTIVKGVTPAAGIPAIAELMVIMSGNKISREVAYPVATIAYAGYVATANWIKHNKVRAENILPIQDKK